MSDLEKKYGCSIPRPKIQLVYYIERASLKMKLIIICRSCVIYYAIWDVTLHSFPFTFILKMTVFLGLHNDDKLLCLSVCHLIQPLAQGRLIWEVKTNRTASTGGPTSCMSKLYSEKETSGPFEAKCTCITLIRSVHSIRNTHWTGF